MNIAVAFTFKLYKCGLALGVVEEVQFLAAYISLFIFSPLYQEDIFNLT